MGDTTNIEWADHTGSPWYVCTEVSEACANCYAKALSKGRMRSITGGGWGKDAPRVKSKGFWDNALTWDRRAEKKGRAASIFPSLCDPFDDAAPIEWFVELLDLIRRTPNLQWLLLTKRPQLVLPRLYEARNLLLRQGSTVLGEWWETYNLVDCWKQAAEFAGNELSPQNVALGVTVENQRRADQRRDVFLALPARKKFVSYEPALGPVDWAGWEFVHQIIAGGESSDETRAELDCARPAHPDWFTATRDWCHSHKRRVSFFFKQWGNWQPHPVPATPEKNNGAGVYVLENGRLGCQGDYWDGRAAGMTWVGKHGRRDTADVLDGEKWKEAL